MEDIKKYRFMNIQEAYSFLVDKLEGDEAQLDCIDYLAEFREMGKGNVRNSGVFLADGFGELQYLMSYEEEYMFNLNFMNEKLYGRYLFPVLSVGGSLLAWIGYDWEHEMKYSVIMLGLGDKKRLLFGLDKFSEMLEEDTIIIQEGIFDTLRLRDIGIDTSVSLLGKQMSRWQKRFLNRFKNKILIPDGDESGRKMKEQWLRGLEGNICVINLSEYVTEFGGNKIEVNDLDSHLRYGEGKKEEFIKLYGEIKERFKQEKYIEIDFF